MKTPKQNSKSLYLQKSNNRWKWMAGATAATAAGLSASEASTITINLVNNYISGGGGNHLNADLTGDGHPDLTIATPFTFFRTPNMVPYHYYSRASAGVRLNGVLAHVSATNQSINETYMQLGSRYGHHYNGSYGTPYLRGSIPIFFKDLHINGGAPTRGSLQVTVGPELFAAEIQLDSFRYTSNNPLAGASRAVPDQGSTLSLLAMGAGGILALRRRRAAKSSNPQLPAQAL